MKTFALILALVGLCWFCYSCGTNKSFDVATPKVTYKFHPSK